MSKTILVVDDKPNVRTLVREYLTEEGFHVATADNGRSALLLARDTHPNLILLDIMMPEMDGYEFLRVYRKEHNTPIILLTAKLEESDKVVGLELGADDYVTKPFGMRELTARIRAVLRRTAPHTGDDQNSILRVADITLDRHGHAVSVGGQSVRLTPSEFTLLEHLMLAPGRVYSRMNLLEKVQGNAIEGMERTIDVHIRNLRTKIEPDPANPRYIETVFGVGYRFRPD